MIEVGLVGFGLAGRAFHALVIRAVPGLHLAAILQRTGTEAAEEYPDVRIVRSLDELLSISEIRLVVIATPNETHYPFARQCLEAGRDVVVDKPFTTTLEDAVSLVQLAKSANRLLTVYQNRRFPSHSKAGCGRNPRPHRPARNKLRPLPPAAQARRLARDRAPRQRNLIRHRTAPDRSCLGSFWPAGSRNRRRSSGTGKRRHR